MIKTNRLMAAGVLIGALVIVCAASLPAEEIHFSAAAKYSRKTGGKLLLVWKNGFLQHDDPIAGFTPDTPTNIFSITKSLTALAWLARPDFSASRRFPGWATDRSRGDVTLGTLLSQTSGLSPGFDRLYSANVTSIRNTAATLPLVQPPGASFHYGPVNYELLGTWVDPRPDGSDGAKRFLEKNILDHLDIHPCGWRRDAMGKIYVSAGMFLSANDLLKVGRLILDGGQANPFHRVVPKENMQQALTGSRANPAYGLGFWLNAQASARDARERDIESTIASDMSAHDWQLTCLSRLVPPDMVAMVGSGGQRVYVVPSWNMVIVRIGKPGGFRDPEFFRALASGH